MTEPAESPDEELTALRAPAQELEAALAEAREKARAGLLRSELKTHAVRAGMIDLDGLKLIETDHLVLSDSGELENGAGVIASLRKRKPWLFGDGNSSSAATPPPSAPPQRKSATEMSHEEWRAARAEILKRK